MNARVRAAVLVLLFAGAGWTSARDYAQLVREAFSMLRLPYEERREHVLGGNYVVMRKLARELPRDARVDIVLRRPQDIDRGIFLNYYLFPRVTRIHVGAIPRGQVVVLVDGSDIRVVSP